MTRLVGEGVLIDFRDKQLGEPITWDGWQQRGTNIRAAKAVERARNGRGAEGLSLMVALRGGVETMLYASYSYAIGS